MIYTSYFSNIKNVLSKKPNMRFCSIAGKTPDWFLDYDAKLGLNSFKCKSLMPKYEWWKTWKDLFAKNYESDESKAWYTEKYVNTVLAGLNAKELAWKMLETADHNDVCLLCYETPGKFCHRHIVAKWLNDNGIACAEI